MRVGCNLNYRKIRIYKMQCEIVEAIMAWCVEPPARLLMHLSLHTSGSFNDSPLRLVEDIIALICTARGGSGPVNTFSLSCYTKYLWLALETSLKEK